MILKVELVSRVAALLVAAAWAGIVLSCIGGWIKECAVTQYSAFKKLSCFSRLAILILFGFYTYIGATKQCNPHFDHNSSALKEVCFTPQALLNSSSSESDNTTDSLTTNEVFITRFEKSDDGVEIDVDREMESSSSSAEISVFLSTNILASSEWSYATNATFAANQTNLTIAVSNADSSVLSSPQAFYAVGLNVDSDNDGLIDFLERHIYRTDPFNPDSDFDGIIDGEEVRRGLRPGASDSDSDGLDDGEEIGYITRSSSPLPWLDFVEAEDITSILSDHYSTLVSLPRELYIQNNTVTNAAVSRSGVILLNRKDHAGNTTSYSTELRNPVSLYSLVLAPYSDTTQVYLPDVPSHFDSSVKVGRAVLHNSEYVLFEFINMYRTLPTSTYASQAVSYQVAIPAVNPTRAYIRYRGVSGEDMNGKYATVGFQSFGCKRTHIYCRNQNGAIYNDLCLQFVLGTNTDPAKFDSDNDGLFDGYERMMRTDPTRPDTDMDGMPDKWELDYGLNPRSSDGEDGASGDPDQDGLTNLEEYENNANPQNADTDGDGVGDFDEVENALDPNSAVDGGSNVSLDEILNMPFRIGGDFAAWTLLIDGLGPTDYRTFRFSKIYATGSYAQTSKRLRKGNRYRLRLKWLHCEGHEYDAYAPWYCWGLQLGEQYLPRSATYDSNSGVRLPDVANEIIGEGWVVDNRSGLLTYHVHENEAHGGNVAEKLESMLHVFAVPVILADYNRDGIIDAKDAELKNKNHIFRFWLNDDEDRLATDGKYSESPRVNIPGAKNGWWEADMRDPDYESETANGICDLLDFTPIFVDVSRVLQEYPMEVRTATSLRLRHDDGAIKVVWTDMAKTNVQSFLREGRTSGYGESFGAEADCAPTVSITQEGILMPSAFADRVKNSGGVFLIEGCKSTTKPLWIEIVYQDSVISSNKLDLCISSVENMYRKVSLRSAATNPSVSVAVPQYVSNQPSETKDLDVFFLHGFNVSEDDARAWGAEVFKRLWQSGSNAKFHILPWHGDYSWSYGSMFNGLHYQHNVWYAQRTGNALKRYIEAAQPDSTKRILMTQSLGNMVACEALREGLQVNQYYMFDAAIPSESIDASLRAESSVDTPFNKYVRPEWHNYPNACWSANWYRLFEDDPADSRGRMTWANRFADALNNANKVFNYYSSGDSVFLETATVPPLFEDVFHNLGINWFLWLIPYPTVDTTFDNHCWQKQEVLKGMATLAGTLSGGWGFNVWNEYDGQAQEWKSVCYSPAGAMAAIADHSITNRPAFDVSDATEMMNPNATEDDIFLALAKHVPALSSPVGGKAILSSAEHNIDMNDSVNGIVRPNNWGRSEDSFFGSQWLHSDMKDMAYFYVYKLYDELVRKGGLKCEEQ